MPARPVSALDDMELRRRAIEGVRAEVELLSAGSPGFRLIQRDGLVASLTPATPDRSLFNAVYYEDPAALAVLLDELAAIYDEAGIRAWTVWVPDDDRETAALLAARGHVLDASPRAMAMSLGELAPERPAPEGVERVTGDARSAGLLNNQAYGYSDPAFGAALGATNPRIEWALARLGSEPVSCVGTIELGDDACVTAVATLPEHQGRGIASWLMREELARARDRGLATGSLQATKDGAPVYERLGFRDFGFIEMWEHRVPAPG